MPSIRAACYASVRDSSPSLLPNSLDVGLPQNAANSLHTVLVVGFEDPPESQLAPISEAIDTGLVNILEQSEYERLAAHWASKSIATWTAM